MSFELKSKVSEQSKATICEFFKTMDYLPAESSDGRALEWLKKHRQPFSGFVNGLWIPPNPSSVKEKICDLFTGKELADVQLVSSELLQNARDNSLKAFDIWGSLNGYKRSKFLYNIGRYIQEAAQLFAVVESVSSGKHLNKTQNKDVPNLIQSFYDSATLASSWEMDVMKCKPLGAVCVIAEKYNNPLMSVSWRVGPILAAGNTVLLLVDAKSCFSAFLLAEICSISGLPPGVLNVLPTDHSSMKNLPTFEKIMFPGCCSESLAKSLVSRSIDYEVCTPRQPTIIVYEQSDLHSAAESVLETLFFNDTRVPSSGCRVLVQECVEQKFLSHLEHYFSNIVVGSNLSKTDLSGIVTEQQHEKLTVLLEEAKKQNAKITYGPELKSSHLSWKPTLVSNIQISSRIVHEKVGGPIIAVLTFRTAKESIAMYNHEKHPSDVIIWLDNMTCAMEVAHKLKAKNIWFNSQNLCDINIQEAKFQAMFHFSKSCKGIETVDEISTTENISYENFGVKPSAVYNIYLYEGCEDDGKPTYLNVPSYKLYVGGLCKKSSTNVFRLLHNPNEQAIAYVPGASAADVHSAVSSAVAAKVKWQTSIASSRSQLLYKLAVNLESSKEMFSKILHESTYRPIESCDLEIIQTVKRLFFWASQANRIQCSLQETAKGRAIEVCDPLGVVGILCPDDYPLETFVSLIALALACGNTVVAIPSETYPVPALNMCQIFDKCGVPPGAINVISGSSDHLVRHLSLNMSVDAMWYHNKLSMEGMLFMHTSPGRNLKKLWCQNVDDLLLPCENTTMEFMSKGTQTKMIHLPMGDIFAN